MKGLLAVLAAALVATAAPAPARAAAGLFLTWGDCALSGAGTANLSFLCDTDLGDNRLYLAFSLDQPVDQVLGMEAVVDLQTSIAPLDDWWHLESAGPGTSAGCRAGDLSASRDFSGDPACMDPWTGTSGDALVADYRLGQPRGGTNQARIRASASVSGTDPALTLDATHTYYGIKLVLSNALTSTCAGCLAPACLVLNSIWLLRSGAPGGDVLLSQPGPGDQNWARWQGDTVQDCTAVPVRRTTWGEIKSLYRR